jgi:hypothetical protein
VCFLATEKELSWSRFTSLAYGSMNEAEFEDNERHLLYKRTSDPATLLSTLSSKHSLPFSTPQRSTL